MENNKSYFIKGFIVIFYGKSSVALHIYTLYLMWNKSVLSVKGITFN